jgi:hypothetical protein
MSTSDWGPRMWRILHVIGEKHRLPTYNSLIIALLENLYNVLPCAVCRKHCREYWIGHMLRGPSVISQPVRYGSGSGSGSSSSRGSRGSSAISTVAPSFVSWEPLALREWLWLFHNAVSARVQKDAVLPIPPFSHESLDIYATLDVKADIEYIYAYMSRYTIQHGLNPQPFQHFKGHLDKLRAIYGF